MSKMEQALILDPPTELHFKAPFTDVTTSYLNLTNPSEKHICFKVKTTAPKTYCVRPNSGVVAPKETIAIAVMLQPVDLESADKSKHKFMVQSMFVPEGETNQENLWREAPPEGLMNSKLKCVFDLPLDNSQSCVDSSKQEELKEDKTLPISVAEVPKTASPKVVNIDVEARKVFEDNKRLKIELNELRQENSTLKEEGLRYRLTSDTRSRTAAAKPFSTSSESRQLSDDKQQPAISNSLIVLAVFIFLLGLYLGKSIL